MRHHYLQLAMRAILPTIALTTGAATAEAQQSATADSVASRLKTYSFNRKAQPVQLAPYNTVAYSRDANAIHTMRGDVIADFKYPIRTFAVSPAGASYFVITNDKKGLTEGGLYSTAQADKRIAKYDVKKFGHPVSAVYTADARNIIVSSDTGLYVFDARTLYPLREIASPLFVAQKMAVSPNGYYLAIIDGDEVAVYNLEERTLRMPLDLGAVVSGVRFSPDSSEMGVLTDDGTLNLYGTRGFELRKTLDVGGDGLACDYNFDGKYMAVATAPDRVELVNLLKGVNERDVEVDDTGVNDLCFLTDASGNTLLAYTQPMSVKAKRLPELRPYYNKLVADEVDLRMAEWLKMMPGETMEEYRLRVNDETRAAQRRLFEDEISTDLAGDLLGSSIMSLGSYDRANNVLAIEFDTMPTIYLPVAEADLGGFTDAGTLQPREVRYGLMPDDTFEIIYAQFYNTADGKTYTYDNVDRVTMDYMSADDAVSLEIIQQQQMEEIRLQELREQVLEEARHNNVISNHTDISVDSRVEADYNANGERILNYLVNFTYTVDPEFSATEDFGPGKYLVEESGAASSMLRIVKEAFEGDFAQYVKEGKRLRISLTGTADATPIIRTIPYNGVYGEYTDEPVYVDGQLSTLSVTSGEGVGSNEQLALLRALGVQNFLENNVEGMQDMRRDYDYHINVSEDKGSAFRRITAQFVFVDVF